MALPPQAIEQLSREPIRTPGWSGKLMMFSSTLLFLSVCGWIGLTYGYEPHLSSQLAQMDAQIKTASQQITPENQTKLLGFYSQLANLDKIINNHIYASNIFDFLERNTQTNIFFSKLDFVTDERKLVLGGVAKSVKDITDQIQILQNQPEVQSAGFSNVAVAAGNLWQFDATVIFVPGFLNLAPTPTSAGIPPDALAPPASTTSTR